MSSPCAESVWKATGQDAAAASAATSRWPIILAAAVIVLAAAAAYHNSFDGALIYDDEPAILNNPTIRQLWPPWNALFPPCEGETVGGRPLLNLSLAINYALGGLKVRGYHATNLLIHIAAAWLLFGILRRTFLLPALRDRFGRAATPLALASALLWALHPLQTESVTYIIQRAESLMGFFYLLTLYCVIRGATPGTVSKEGRGTRGEGRGARGQARIQPTTIGGNKGDCPPSPAQIGGRSGPPAESLVPRPSPLVSRLWYAAAVVACLSGMACKEVMVTAPLVVLLYDRTFLTGSFRQAWRRRWGLYLSLAAAWALLGYLVFSTGLIGRQSEFGATDAWSYARSQPGVILHYLRLSAWPGPLCLDYEWPVADTLGEILPGTAVVGLLLAATLWGLTGRRVWGFLGAWFLLILAPTSSVLPLRHPAFEHRMYLPLAAAAVLVAAGGYALWDTLLRRLAVPAPGMAVPAPGMAVLRWAAPVTILAGWLGMLGYATVSRNSDYRSAIVFFQDNVDKRPYNVIAHYSLANALVAAGRTDDAIEHYLVALHLRPDYRVAHYNLGNVLARSGKTNEAIRHYQEALRLKPDSAEPHNNLGLTLASVGRTSEAIEHYQEALRLKPDFAEAHNNLGNALAGLGRIDEAIEPYRQAVRHKPDYAKAHNNLGVALAKLGKTDEAIEHFSAACRLKPDFAVAHYRLANVLAAEGKTHEAIRHYRQCLELMPDSKEALNNLAWLLATHESAEGGDPAQAVELAGRARGLAGQENAQCLDTLAAAYAAAGRFDDAVITAEHALRLADSSGQVLARKIRLRLELYRAGRPYREGPQGSAEK